MDFEAQTALLAADVQGKDLTSGDAGAIHAAAAAGVQGTGSPLPHQEAIQRSFGRHDVSNVQAHMGGAARRSSEAIGAKAYAAGDGVAFASTPDLHTVAHEAAHVVQQRAGVSLPGGVGQSGDRYEQHADQVADRVVRGESAEGLLDTMAGAPSVQRKAVQRDGDTVGLKTTQGVIKDWAVAVSTVAGAWRHVQWGEERGVDSWYGKVEKEDPPPLWQELLKQAVLIGIGALTGGVGAVVVGKLNPDTTKKLTTFIVNTAVEAGKGIITTAAGSAVTAATEQDPGDAKKAFAAAQKDTISQTIKQKELKTAVEMDQASRLAEGEKWKAMQSIYDAITAAQAYARTKAHDETLFGWMSMQAKKEYGAVARINGVNAWKIEGLTITQKLKLDVHITEGKPLNELADKEIIGKLKAAFGKGWKEKDPNYGLDVGTTTNVEKLADKIDTSSVGTIGFHLKDARDPLARMQIDYVELESSIGNTEQVRKYLLKTDKKVSDYPTPKVVISGFLNVPHRFAGGFFELAYDEKNNGAVRSYGGARIDSSGTNAGRTWLALYGLDSKRDLSEKEVDAGLWKGVEQIKRDILGRSLKASGVSNIST